MKRKAIPRKVVSSKIEITKPIAPQKGDGKVTVDARSLSLQQYHTDVNKMGQSIEKYALTLSNNLLSIKMALMQSVQSIERRLRGMRE